MVLLAKSWHKAFLARRKDPTERVIVVPTCAGLSEAEDFENDPATLEAFLQQMQQEHFDLACQLQDGDTYSNAYIQCLSLCMSIRLRAEDAPYGESSEGVRRTVRVILPVCLLKSTEIGY